MDTARRIPADDLLGQIAERARLVPDSLREFTETTERAVRYHRVPETVLTKLVELGLPHSRGPGRLSFDRRDLRNIALRARLPSPHRDVVANAARALCADQPSSSATWELEVVGRCPEPAHAGRCELDLHPAVHDSGQASVRRISAGHYRLSVTVPAGPPAQLMLTDDAAELFRSVADLEFQHLPQELTTDLTFLHDTGLADCRLAGFYLHHESALRGVRLRPAAGLLLARPFSMTHSWIEIWSEGRWQPADPFFLTALARWGLVRPDRWPIDRSPTGVLWHIGATDLPLMTDRGEPIDPMLVTA